MQLLNALVKLADQNCDAVNDWYSWRRIRPESLPPGIVLDMDQGQYRQNLRLKLALHRLWTEQPARRVELARYIVATWGGVKRNHPATLASYVTRKPREIIADGSRGIASWSKVLCIRDPSQYAIYDARVSMSLNALQVAEKVERPSLFPILSSQNRSAMPRARQGLMRHMQSNDWLLKDGRTFYSDYLRLLHDAAEESSVKPKPDIMTLEMLLFSKFNELVDRAFPPVA